MEKPSNSGWSHLWLLGMGPNRASERFQSYKDSKGLSSIGHLALAILEHAPVVGGTISFLDRAISHYTSPTTAKVTSVAYSVLDVEESTTNLDSKKQVSQVDEILRDKLTLAIRENSSVGSSFYCSIDEISTTPCSYSLNFKEEVNIRKSSREDITDAHCSFDIQPKSGVDKPVEGKCYAVFDGYGGGDFAGYINGNFQKIFPSLLRQIKTNDGELDIQQAFQKFVDLMHAAAGKGEFMSSRSAALMCYVDTKTNIAHIATVGSSQAYVVRKIGNESKIIPLSYDNTWNSTKHKEAKEKIEEFQLNNQKKLDSKKDLGSFEKEKILSNEKKLGSIWFMGRIGGIVYWQRQP
jgi:serine/threonine protein phosphatase PrpC